MSGRRCAEVGCGRFVGTGWARCGRHRGDETGDAEFGADGDAREHGVADAGDGAARRQARATFRQALARGEYRALLDGRLVEVLAQAAAERGLGDEIGALRFVLKRLLAEEEDLGRLAAGVARVTGVAIRAARAERAISGEAADGLTAALTQILMELDGE